MFRSQKQYGPIAVDFGASNLKMIQLADLNGDPAIVAAAYCPLPPGGEQGADPQSLREALVNALRGRSFQGRKVVSALGLREFQMKNLRVPTMPAEEMAAGIELEARDRFSLKGEAQIRHVCAGEVRHGNELKEEVIAFAAEDRLISDRLELLESVGLTPVGLDLTPCAIMRSFLRFFRRSEDMSAVNVFLDVGRLGSCIMITRGAQLCFVKALELGGERLTSAVAQNLNLPMAEAQALRVRVIHAAAGRRTEDKNEVSAEVVEAMTDAMRPIFEQIARDLQLCMRYFAVTFRGPRPDSVTLVGGEAHEPGLAMVLSQAVDVPCLVGDPLRGLPGAGRLADREHRTLRPAWAVACGLALRGTPWVARVPKPSSEFAPIGN